MNDDKSLAPGTTSASLRDLTDELGYEMGVARRSDLNPAAREHVLVPGGTDRAGGHRLLCGYGPATRQASYSGTDCPKCLAMLRAEKAQNDAEDALAGDEVSS